MILLPIALLDHLTLCVHCSPLSHYYKFVENSVIDLTYFILSEQVLDDTSSVRASLRKRLTADDPDLTTDEQLRIKEFLEACPDED